MDIQHFEIMVNAMLSWSDEAKSPRKEARHAAAAPACDDIDGVDEFVDDGEDEDEDDDFGADAARAVKPDAGAPRAAWPDAERAQAEQAD